tara:strand:+ start:190 stop:390 length:201 start_codon:yes stop_codon:yes gene_type:complete
MDVMLLMTVVVTVLATIYLAKERRVRRALQDLLGRLLAKKGAAHEDNDFIRDRDDNAHHDDTNHRM